MKDYINTHNVTEEIIISVIVPVYNVEAYLRQCLDSIIGQTYRCLQIILVDDGSTDQSGAICDEYALMDRRIEVIHQQNQGVSVARNSGLEVAVGEYITFVDSDDYLELMMYEHLLTAAEEKDADITICDYHRVYQSDRTNSRSQAGGKSRLSVKMITPDQFFEDITVYRFLTWNKLFRSEVVMQLRFIPKQIHQEIYYVSRAVFNCNRIGYINEELYNYRVNREGSTNTGKFSDNRFGIINEFNFIIQELITKNYSSALISFSHYVLTYYMNEYKIANHLHGTSVQKKKLINIFRKTFAETKFKEIMARYGNKIYIDIKLFHFWPLLHYRYHDIRSKVKRLMSTYVKGRKMIYLSIKGRLGNQLFQYAFARYVQMVRKDDLTIDWSQVILRHKEDGDGWENSLNFFNIADCKNKDSIYIGKFKRKILKGYIILRYYEFFIKYPFFYKIYRKIIQIFGIYMYPQRYTKHNVNVKNVLSNDIYIEGYYESSKYFEKIDDIIKEELTPRFPPLEKNKKLYDIIHNTNSICVSIRRGDFFTDENSKIYGVCDADYFYKGIDYIRIKNFDSTVILFSDDMEWVKTVMKFPYRVYYEDGTDPVWEKLRLMYSCKHFVISNSTFSWWAQHLSRNKNKIVVAPRMWRTTDEVYDVREDNWVILN